VKFVQALIQYMELVHAMSENDGKYLAARPAILQPMKMQAPPMDEARKGDDRYLTRQQVKLVHTMIESDGCEGYLRCVVLCQPKPALPPMIESDGGCLTRQWVKQAHQMIETWANVP
jgi:hypothetical protein